MWALTQQIMYFMYSMMSGAEVGVIMQRSGAV